MDTVEELYNALPMSLRFTDKDCHTYTGYFIIEKIGGGVGKNRIRYMQWSELLPLSKQNVGLEVVCENLVEGLLEMLCKVKVYRDEHKDI